VNGDGLLDVAITFPYADPLATDCGLLQVVSAPLPPAWTDFGGGLAGAAGIPQLQGTGLLSRGTPGSLQLSAAAPDSPVLLIVALTHVDVPFKGGTLSAFPPVASVPLVTGAGGDAELPWLAWPALPSGLELWLQAAVADAGAPHGVALSNLLRGVVQP